MVNNEVSKMGTLHGRAVGLKSLVATSRISIVLCSLVVPLYMLPFVASMAGPRHSAGHRWETREYGSTTLVGGEIEVSKVHKEDLSTYDLFSLIVPSEKHSSVRRALFNGLGSVPPLCYFKCGNCNPCNPVHVPIQPGLVKTTEYYPEAWRCQCGQKLYMP